MCSVSMRGIMWRAASAAVGSVGLAVCAQIAPVAYSDASSRLDASSLMLKIVERSVPAAIDCVLHVPGRDERTGGLFACAEWTLHAARALAGDNGSGREAARALFDSHVRQ